MDIKRTKGDKDSEGNLNGDNPNRDRTPIQSREDTSLVGGTAQHNYDDEIAGTAPEATREDKEGSPRH